ncbi:hypothetical protein [Pilimelia columellifera]|uniref:Cytochrome P450 n=1 Tax=Pilimelia columellifera subsp. columellifera TaxID=706583 RepID=A0ABN3NPL0_9ACTN
MTFAVDLSHAGARRDGGERLRWLRRSFGPVLPCARPAGMVVLSAELARQALADPARYSSSIMAGADAYLLGADGPAHRQARRGVLASLRAPADPAGVVRSGARARRLVGRFVAAGGGEAVTVLARPLAQLAAARVIGVSVPTIRGLARWAQAAVGAATGGSTAAPADVAALSAQATADVRAALLAGGRRPGSLLDLTGTAVADGTLSLDAAVEIVLLVALATLDTTTALLAACLHELASAQPVAVPDEVVAAVLAARSPVRFVRRVATETHTLGGTAIGAGQPVLVHLRASADDLPPADAGRLAFGAGPHACPGASLARAVAVATVAACAGAWLTLNGPPTNADSVQIDGYARLPLRAARRPGPWEPR